MSKIKLSEAIHLANFIRKKINVESYVVGSIRRKKEFVKDIDILVVLDNLSTNLSANLSANLSSKFDIEIERNGPKLMSGRLYYNDHYYNIDIFYITKKELPFAMLHFTGPMSYNVRLRKYVKTKYNWKLNQYGLFYKNNKRVLGSSQIKTERDLINFIGTTYYEPKNRM
jgi:DNA polymerase/3'-5' exonuclease PolX